MIIMAFLLTYALAKRMKLVEEGSWNWATSAVRVDRQKVAELLTGFYTEHVSSAPFED